MVVIDQQYAFVGGIDLCFMRYDDDEFTLVDLEGEKFPGRIIDKMFAYSLQIRQRLWQSERICQKNRRSNGRPDR